MTELKPYIQQLFLQYKTNVEKRHEPLLDTFAKSEAAKEAHNEIKEGHKKMLERWKEHKRIEEVKAKQLALPNGTVNKPYAFDLDLKKLELGGLADLIGDYNVAVDEKTGLAFSKEESKLSGFPKEQGDHVLDFRFRLKSESGDSPFHVKKMTLIVNHDPKSLWKDEPTPKDIEYHKADERSAHSEFGGKRLIVGSKRGRSHAHEAKPREDAFDFKYDEDSGWGVIAVADGAGSATYSRQGSEIACEAITDFFGDVEKEKLRETEAAVQDFLSGETEENRKKVSGLLGKQLVDAAFAALQKIKDEAATKGRETRDYATTLIFALVKKYGDKYLIASFWVGDGGIGIYSKERNEVIVLGTPDSGEFAGQTRFLTMGEVFADDSVYNRVRLKVVEDFTALVLMTDGITDAKFGTDANLHKIEKWHEMWDDLNGNNPDSRKVGFENPIEEAERDLMAWLDFWSQGNHDDRTIAILY